MRVVTVDRHTGAHWYVYTDEPSVIIVVDDDELPIGIGVAEPEIGDHGSDSAFNWLTLAEAEEVYAALGAALAKVALRANK